MKYWFKEWQKEEGKETERRKVRENGMMRNERLFKDWKKEEGKENWETKSKRKKNDEEWNIYFKEWEKEEWTET